MTFEKVEDAHSFVFNELQSLIKSFFSASKLVLKETSTSADVPGWDSLSHVRLIMAVEKHFNVRFNPEEMTNPQNVGELAEVVQSKIVN